MSGLNSQVLAEDQHRRQLLALIALGSRDAFNQLYRSFYAPLSRFVYRYTQSPDLVEEIVNDTLMVVWQKAHSFRGDSQVSTWIMGIAARKSHLALRQRYRAEHTPIDQLDIGGNLNTLFEEVSKTEMLERALQGLSSIHRAVIELTYMQGYTCSEVSEILDCPVSTVKTRLHYARKRLRQVLMSCGEGGSVSGMQGGEHD